jgi:hypothetical protein
MCIAVDDICSVVCREASPPGGALNSGPNSPARRIQKEEPKVSYSACSSSTFPSYWKGRCHEIVVENRPKLRFADTFFCKKSAVLTLR